MATFNSGRKALANVASKATSAMQCYRNTSSVCEIILANAGRSLPRPCPVSASANCSSSPLLGNRSFSSYLLRIPAWKTCDFVLPKELACMQSLLPLDSVTASSRLVSLLSTTAGPTPANLNGMLTHMSPDR